MNRLIICTFAVVSLNSFGAAGPELALAQQSQGATKSDALQRLDLLQRLITVTQGPSKMPFSLAFRPIGEERVCACLVASPKLHESISSDVAQVLVDALLADDTGYLQFSDKKGSVWSFPHATWHSICESLVYKEIAKDAVNKDLMSNTLVVFYAFCKYRSLFKDLSVVAMYTFDRKYVERYEFNRLKRLAYKKYDLSVELNYDVFEKYALVEPGDCSIL